MVTCFTTITKSDEKKLTKHYSCRTMTEFLWIAVKSTIKFLSYDLNSQQKKMFMEVLRFRMIEELHSAEELSNSSWHQRPTSNIHFQISKSQSKFISISTPLFHVVYACTYYNWTLNSLKLNIIICHNHHIHNSCRCKPHKSCRIRRIHNCNLKPIYPIYHISLWCRN